MRRSLAPAVLLILFAAGCAAPHRLAEAELEGRTVAVIAAIPPADLVSGPWPVTDRRYLPPGPVRRRHEAARRGQARLDAAARRVDVADLVARRALVGSARALGLRPVADPREADLVLDVRLLDYGLRARSFTGPVALAVEADIVLVERATEEVLWRRRVRERRAAPPEAFGLEGRRLTAAELAERSEDEMAAGLARMAALTADGIVERIGRARPAAR